MGALDHDNRSPEAGTARQARERIELPDDRFVPVDCRDLVEAIEDDADRFEAVAGSIAKLTDRLEDVIDQETAAFQRQLSRRYDRFDPARETVDVGTRKISDVDEVRSLVAYLLDKANYERLEDRQIDAALSVTNSHGIRIRVHPERVESIDLFVRGQIVAQDEVRTIRAPVRGEVREVELYRRLAVVFREAGEDHLNLKLFRDIPTADVEALLPHAEVEMTPWDRIKVIGYGLGAFGGLVTKAVGVFLQGTIAAGQFLWAGIAALLGLSLRSVLGYRRAKYVRASQMTHNLYYQNVANNAGVLGSLLSNISQEELKEAMLAYAMLACRPAIRTVEELNDVVEDWLHETFAVRIDFDGVDAIETLDRLHLWNDASTMTVLDPDQAVARLADHCVQRKTVSYHFDAWRRRTAD